MHKACNRNILNQFLVEHNIHITIIQCDLVKTTQTFSYENDSCNNNNCVAILVRNDISYSKFITYFDDSLQNIRVRIKIDNKTISNCTPNFDKNIFDTLLKSIPAPMILGGDLNARHLVWGCNTTKPRGRDILDVIDDNGLVFLNDGQVTTVGTDTFRPKALN